MAAPSGTGRSWWVRGLGALVLVGLIGGTVWFGTRPGTNHAGGLEPAAIPASLPFLRQIPLAPGTTTSLSRPLPVVGRLDGGGIEVFDTSALMT